MSESLTEQLSRSFDALADRLRASVADQLAVTADQLAAGLEAERRAAAESAARDAAAAAEREVTARLSGDFARREEQLREDARGEWFAAGLKQGRDESAASVAAAQEQAAAAITALRDEQAAALAAAARDHAEALDAARGEHRIALEARSQQHAAELEAASNHHAAALAAIRDEHAAELAALHAGHAEARDDRRRAHDAALERLVRAARELDAATSLSQILEALAAAAGRETDRTAIFVVRGDRLRLWTQSGFTGLAVDPAYELPLAFAGVAADAARTALPQQTQTSAPAFIEHLSGTFFALPLTLNGDVVAVLCAEQAVTADSVGAAASALDLLARHASRALESLTAMRLAQAGPRGSMGVSSPTTGM